MLRTNLMLFVFLFASSWVGCGDGWRKQAHFDLAPPDYCRYPDPLLAPTEPGPLGREPLMESGTASADDSAHRDGEPTASSPADDGPLAMESSRCVDINLDDAEALTRLPGVGPGRAEKIVAMRQKRPFTKLRHLRRVKGIGARTLAKMKPMLCAIDEKAADQ